MKDAVVNSNNDRINKFFDWNEIQEYGVMASQWFDGDMTDSDWIINKFLRNSRGWRMQKYKFLVSTPMKKNEKERNKERKTVANFDLKNNWGTTQVGRTRAVHIERETICQCTEKMRQISVDRGAVCIDARRSICLLWFILLFIISFPKTTLLSGNDTEQESLKTSGENTFLNGKHRFGFWTEK